MNDDERAAACRQVILKLLRAKEEFSAAHQRFKRTADACLKEMHELTEGSTDERAAAE